MNSHILMSDEEGLDPEVRLPNWLEYHAHTTPNRVALLTDGRTWTWAQLGQSAENMALRLTELSVLAGDHVGVLLSNGPEFVIAVHALMRLGAVLVPLNTRLTPSELEWQLRDAGVKLLIHDETNAPQSETLRTLSKVRTVSALELGEGISSSSEGLLPHPVSLSTVHSIVYTSGTTGTPKGALITYGNHWWSAAGSAINLGSHRDDRWLAVLPFFHVGGLAILMRSAIYGTPIVVHSRFDPVAVNAAIEHEGVTLLSVVSNMLRRMLDESQGVPYPRTLRSVLLGGGPAPRPLLEECASLDVPVLQTYGMTETASQAVTLSPEEALSKLGSAGKPLLPTNLRIEQGGREAAPEEVGEILLRGPNVSPGYLGHPKDTGRTLDGWLRTGDAGYLDTEGYLYVLDRRDDLIITGGENVYPAEVETVLASHPAVLEAGVTGRPDPRWGESVSASVVLRPGTQASTEALRAYCRERLASYKVPAGIEFLPELPRTASGKLLRRQLRERHASS